MKFGIEPISTREFGKVGLLETTTDDRSDANKVNEEFAEKRRNMLEELDLFFDK